ncbi:MAG: hypothetical protein VB081_08885 [Christensenella sp.]|uniref:hypothetical protein n=1 Tax=Christensenella sp. TaxID=1935934 RepID=UPI002B1EC0D6|nr:hypothetical protein [Christensenella sp.]MEA5003600.1 hypothetical protein [Christensenella sp.]
MSSVLLILNRRILGDTLIKTMKDSPQFQLHTEYEYNNAVSAARTIQPAVAVLELSNSGEWTIEKCIALCDRLKEACFGVKILVLCPEGNKEACNSTVTAVQAGRVDDFVFYDSSRKYLISKLESMTQNGG